MSDEISEAQIAAELQHHPAATRDEAWRKAEFALRMRAVLLDEARRLGISAEHSEDLDEEVRETEEEGLIRRLLDCNISVADISDAACQAEYDRDAPRFRSPALFEAAHILVAADMKSPESRAVAKQQAEQFIALVMQKPGEFANLAREHSACPSGSNGGMLGQVTPREIEPEIASMLLAMEPDSICPVPVPSRHGYHVLRLDRKEEGRQLPFDAVRDRIRDHLRRRAWVAEARNYATSLMTANPNDGLEREIIS